jgi:hypothetical protein
MDFLSTILYLLATILSLKFPIDALVYIMVYSQ